MFFSKGVLNIKRERTSCHFYTGSTIVCLIKAISVLSHNNDIVTKIIIHFNEWQTLLVSGSVVVKTH